MIYPLVINHSYSKSPFRIGRSTRNGLFSIAMLNYQRVIYPDSSTTRDPLETTTTSAGRRHDFNGFFHFNRCDLGGLSSFGTSQKNDRPEHHARDDGVVKDGVEMFPARFFHSKSKRMQYSINYANVYIYIYTHKHKYN